MHADRETKKNFLTLSEIAVRVSEWFPALEGRVFASVADDISKDNMPTLDCAVVNSLTTGVDSFPLRGNSPLELFDDFRIEFWLKPQRIKRADGTETPFWAYYDCHSILQTLLGRMQEIRNNENILLEFRSSLTAATDAAVILEYRFRQHYTMCIDVTSSEKAGDFTILTTICPA